MTIIKDYITEKEKIFFSIVDRKRDDISLLVK